MKFNYQPNETDESDNEFIGSSLSSSFIFEKNERNQLRSLRKWLSDMDIDYTVTVIKNDEGMKSYCLVTYDNDNYNDDDIKNEPKKKKKKSKKIDD